MTSTPVFQTPFAELSLERRPPQPNAPLQAFDAADEYLLNELAESATLHAEQRVLILNDTFGALACALSSHANIISSGDSYLAYQALQDNLQSNQRNTVEFIPAGLPLHGQFDWVLIRVPKTLALLEEQLIQLQGHIQPSTRILAAGMVKHLPRSSGDLFERYIGSVQASLAVKKARVLRVTPEPREQAKSPYPTTYQLPEPALTLTNHANVFSRDGLDIGTRFLLPLLKQLPEKARVADLGCGNGVLALAYGLLHPQAELTLVDESFMAVQSSQENWQRAFPDRSATFRADDGLAQQSRASLDLILCNPPFHQQQVVGEFLAWRMFQQAHAALASQGELWIVANRHLGYADKLKRLFAAVDVIATNPKFVVLRARKR